MLSLTQTYAVAAFLLAVGAFVLLALAALAGGAAARLRAAGRPLRYTPWALLAVISVWFGTAIAASAVTADPSVYLDVFVFVPIIGVALTTYLRPVKRLLLAVSLPALVVLQAYRMAGGVFIYPYLVEGALTPGFAWPAGVGDVLTGLLAIPAAWMAWRRARGWRIAVVAHAALGIGDLLNARLMSSAFGFTPEGIVPGFPIMSIPLFFGPALGIGLHILALRRLQLGRQVQHAVDGAPPPMVGELA